jgi:hypothetical protein
MRTQQEVAQQLERYQQVLQRTTSQIEKATAGEAFEELLFLKEEKERFIGGIHALEWVLSSDTDERFLYPWAYR